MSSFFGMQFTEGIFASIWKYFKEKQDNRENIKSHLNFLLEDNKALNDKEDDPYFQLDMVAYISMGLRKKEVSSKETDLTDVLAQHQRVLIVGGAGSGKSTLTRYITFQLASAWSKKSKKDFSQASPRLPALFPLRVELKKCDRSSLEDLICNSIKDVSPEYVKRDLLKRGCALLLFDGLDEVTGSKRQAEIVEEIQHLTRYYAIGDNKFIVTSRYTNAIYNTLGRANYETYHLQPLSTEKKEAMIDNYYQGWMSKRAERKGDSIDLKKRVTTDIKLEQLSNNTFLLSQIIYLHYCGESLPTKRHKLYQRCVEGLVIRKDEPTPEQIEQRLDVLGELALAMFQQEKSFVSRYEANQMLATACQQNAALAAFASTTDQWIDQIINKWAIMRDDTQGYTFVHLSLFQYLVSRAIARNHDKYLEILKSKLGDSSCEEIIYLYIAIRADIVSGPGTMDEILDTLLGQSATPHDNVWIKAGYFLSAIPHKNYCQGKWRSKILERLQMISNSDDPRGIDALEVLCLIEPEGVGWVIEDRLIGQYIFRDKVLTTVQRMRNPEATLRLRVEIEKLLHDGVPLREQEILKDILQNLKKD